MFPSSLLPRCLWVSFAALCCGCAGLQNPGADDSNSLAWLTGKTQPAAESVQPTGPTYTVEMRAAARDPKTVTLAYPGQIHLQDALEQSGARKTFKRMTLYLVRTPPQGGPKQRMTATYDHVERRVAWESDYAVYPGDHIVVTEDTTTEFDTIVNRFLGAFGKR